MSSILLRAAFFAIPFMLAGMVHVAVIKFGLFHSLAKTPLDFGLEINRRRLFGKNKTLRGAVIVISGVTVFWVLEGLVARCVPLISRFAITNLSLLGSICWGVLLGIGWVVGELPNSFIKRRLDIAPGARAETRLFRLFFWVADQVDGVVGVIVVASFHWKLSSSIILALLLLSIVLHAIGDAAMVTLGLKRKYIQLAT